MLDTARRILSGLLILTFCVTGCGEDGASNDASYSEGTTPPEEGDTSDAEGSADAPAETDAEAATPPDAAPAQTGPITEVAIAPSAHEEPMKSAFIFYTAKENAPALAEFHKKDLEAKGWKISRNDVSKLPGTTMSAGIQQYEKGSDVLTIVLAEQIAETTNTSVCVMDIPLPPSTTFINPYGGQGVGEILDPPRPGDCVVHQGVDRSRLEGKNCGRWTC